MRLVGRLIRKISSKLDIAAIAARRKELRARTETVTAPVVETVTVIETPMEIDFFNMEVDAQIVLEGAWIACITEDDPKYGPVIRMASITGSYKELFRYIDLAEEEVRQGYEFGELPDTLKGQAQRWKNNIRRREEGEYCPTCWERDWRYFWREFSNPTEVATKVEGNNVVCQGCNALMGWVKTSQLNV